MKQLLTAVLSFMLLSVTTKSQLTKAADFPVNSPSKEAIKALKEGVALSDWGDYDKSRQWYLKAVELDSGFALAHLFLIYNEPSSEAVLQHLKSARNHIVNGSAWEKFMLEFIDGYITDNPQKRLSTGEEMVKTYPQMARAHFHLASALQDADKNEKSRDHYKKAISLAPEWAIVHQELAYSYLHYEPKVLDQALAYAQKGATLASDQASTHMLLGDIYAAQNQMDKAKTSYSNAIKLAPERAEAYYKRGNANTFTGQYSAARADYLQGGKYNLIFPTETINHLSQVYLHEGQPQKGIALLMEEERKITPSKDPSKAWGDRYDLWFNMAQIAFHLGDDKSLKTAIKHMEPLIDSFTSLIDVDEVRRDIKTDLLYWKGLHQVLTGEYETVKITSEEIKKLLEPIQNPKKLERYHRLLGHNFYRQQQFNEAAEHFEQTSKTAVYDKYWRAKAYENMGQKDKALALYKEIAAYNFSNIGNAMIRNEVQQIVKKN